MANDKTEMSTQAPDEAKKEFKEITIKFGKGLMGDPFMAKDGNEYVQVKIPNKDPNDRSPWATFVVRSSSVHIDNYGNGMWAKLPAEGSTSVRKDFVVGQDAEGKNVYQTETTRVPNSELKKMVEFYKERPLEREQTQDQSRGQKTMPKDAVADKPRESLKSRMSEKKEQVAQTKLAKAAEKPHAKTKGQEL